jgi:hypothetical protein
MAKYDPLTAYLAAVPEPDARVEMRFGDVERLVGVLPASARTYRPWWGNSSHVRVRAWRAAEWHVQEVHSARDSSTAEAPARAPGRLGHESDGSA